MSPSPRRRRLVRLPRAESLPVEHRLALLLRLVIGTAAVVLGVAAVLTATGPAPASYGALLLVAAATLGADATLINIRIGHHVESYTWSEATVVLGLALLAPRHLVLTSLCIGVACLVTGWSPVKTAYNTASYVIGTALAAGATHLVTQPSWDRPGLSAGALVLGAATFSLWNFISIKAAIALSQGLPFREVARRNLAMVALVPVGNVVVALSGLALARSSLQVLYTLPVVLAVIYLGYRARLRISQERQVWAHLEATSQEMGGLEEQQIAAVAVPRAASLLQADAVELCLYGPSGASDEVHRGDASGCTDVRTESRQREDRVAVATYRPLTGHGGEETCAIIPLAGRQEQIGVLRVFFGGHVELSRRERELLASYANALSSNLDNARLFAAVRAQAERQEEAARQDALTGLANRLALEERADQALSDPEGRFAVLLLDLDRFKQVNDVHGHGAGDVLLRTLADRMRRAVRPTDTVARLGGDEFAVVLADGAAAAATAARLRDVLSQPVDVGEGTVVTVGASIGTARFPADGVTWKGLLECADKAMYADKQDRREAERPVLVSLPCHEDRTIALS